MSLSVHELQQSFNDAQDFLNKNQAIEALEALKKFSGDEPEFAGVLHLKGIAYSQLADYSASLECFKLAVEAGDNSPKLAENILLVASELGALDAEILQYATFLMVKVYQYKEAVDAFNQALQITHFKKENSVSSNKLVFENCIIHFLEYLLNNQQYSAALIVESIVYVNFIKQKETAVHFKEHMGKMSALFIQAGRGIRDDLPKLKLVKNESHKVAFFIHNASTLAHVEVLINFCKGLFLMPVEERKITPVVYCLQGADAGMLSAFEQYNIEVILLERERPDLIGDIWANILHFRESLQQSGIDHVVWLSLATIMSMAFAARVARVQTWWALKYHSLSFDDVDGYVCGGSPYRYRRVDDQVWRIGQLGVDNWYDGTLSKEADHVKSKFKGKTILASLGREEKLNDPEFLEVVASILIQREQSVFMWTGRVQDKSIQSFFEKAGVADRTHFIGWVDTRLYAQVIDIFLDSFPFPSGFTVCQALAASKPVVFLKTQESIEIGVLGFVEEGLKEKELSSFEERETFLNEIYEDKNLLLSIHDNVDDYKKHSLRLIDDSVFYKRESLNGKCFLDKFYSDVVKSAKSYAQHFWELSCSFE